MYVLNQERGQNGGIWWICDKCGYMTLWSYYQLAVDGSPVCPKDTEELRMATQEEATSHEEYELAQAGKTT